jgi:hypothetical protein
MDKHQKYTLSKKTRFLVFLRNKKKLIKYHLKNPVLFLKMDMFKNEKLLLLFIRSFFISGLNAKKADIIRIWTKAFSRIFG